ncbi:hypothetical protein ABT095_33700 [Kitasatospora sp. NPDC002227]|uniref:DUF6919 domain-containing protein n=1 Tax=Kitasatospora sp. NPDC002227 TaxID=3154773 RepID=UPI00331837A8
MFKLHLMMSSADRRRWRSVRTAADLGELTAQWLEGRLASRPGYAPGYGPDSETTDSPDLLAALLLCNRSGFVTESSQPGFEGIGADGRFWNQRAAVSGFTNDPHVRNLLRAVAEHHGLLINEYRYTYVGPRSEAIVATTRDGEPYTEFGRVLSPSDVRRIWSGAGREAVHAMTRAWQITLADPNFGDWHLLWQALTEAFTGPSSCPRCGCTPYEPCRDGCYLTTHGAETLCGACAYGRPGIDAPDDFGDDDQGDEDESDFDFDDEPRECGLCGAPYYHAGRYCSFGCEEADAPGPAAPAEEPTAPAPYTHDDPWASPTWG